MDTKLIPLDQVVQTHPSPQENKIETFRGLMREFGIDHFPPILCSYTSKGDQYYILDGTHTSSAAIREGYTHILSEVDVDEGLSPPDLGF